MSRGVFADFDEDVENKLADLYRSAAKLLEEVEGVKGLPYDVAKMAALHRKSVARIEETIEDEKKRARINQRKEQFAEQKEKYYEDCRRKGGELIVDGGDEDVDEDAMHTFNCDIINDSNRCTMHGGAMNADNRCVFP